MQRKRGAKGEASLFSRASGEQQLAEVQHRAEGARRELERAADVGEALRVAGEKVIERGPLVPRLREIRRAAQQARKARLGDVVAARGDVARRLRQDFGGGAVRVIH